MNSILLYPGPNTYPGALTFPGAVINAPVVDEDLWIEVREDPMEYVRRLRADGRIEQGSWYAPIRIPNKPVNPLPLQ